MKRSITPFANESESIVIGELTVENRLDRVSMYGSIDLTRDKPGLAHAEQLKALLDSVIQELKRKPLPDEIVTVEAKIVTNPFKPKS